MLVRWALVGVNSAGTREIYYGEDVSEDAMWERIGNLNFDQIYGVFSTTREDAKSAWNWLEDKALETLAGY